MAYRFGFSCRLHTMKFLSSSIAATMILCFGSFAGVLEVFATEENVDIAMEYEYNPEFEVFSMTPRRLGAPRLTFKGDNPGVLLNECEGDCDSDSDCAGDLVCLQRDSSSPETVPGCTGTSPSKTDFCIKKSSTGYSSASSSTASTSSYALKMYWQSSYRWQESSLETKWCVYCHSGRCKAGDMTYIIDCGNLSQVQIFEFIPTKNGDFLIKVSGTNLCYSRDGNRDLRLFPCDDSNPRQLWFAKSGSFAGGKFEISQREKSMNCVTQRHHPKFDEVLLMEDCELARSSDTSYWVRYPVSKANPTPFPTLLPTPRPSARPTLSSSKIPTSGPTTQPSDRPTKAPSDHPSLRPSAPPTTKTLSGDFPTIGVSSEFFTDSKTLSSPSQVPSDCPPDLELLAVVGSVSYNEDAPIAIVEQGTSFLKFEVKDVWKDVSVSKFYTQIKRLPYGDVECFENEAIDFSGESGARTFTAYCMKYEPITIVNLWISDPTLSWTADNAKVPKCCYPETDLPSVQYTFRINCESKCPPQKNGEL